MKAEPAMDAKGGGTRPTAWSLPIIGDALREHSHLVVYCAKRLALVPLQVFVLVTLSFVLVDLVPVNPGQQILGDLATAKQIQAVNHLLGFDLPVPVRYETYLLNLLHGDLGHSYYSGVPVTSEIADHLPNTIELVVPALFLALCFGLLLGYTTARAKLGRAGVAAKGIYTALQALPDFVIAVILIFIFFSELRLAAAPVGRLGLGDTPPAHVTGFLYIDTLLTGRFDLLGSELSHSILPIISLALGLTPALARISRSNLAAAMNSPHTEFIRACGLQHTQVIRSVLRSSRTPVVTYFGLLAANLVGGAAIVETIFSWNGIGQWAVDAIQKVDLIEVQAFVLVVATAALLIFLAVDLLVAVLDPRISYARR